MTRYSRREFLAALAVAPALVGLTCKSGPIISGGFTDDDSVAGHAVRDGTLGLKRQPVEQRHVPITIIGAGMGGLSAGWRLDALGVRDWLMLELADVPGGNSRSGENGAGRFPWGAHYVPVPGPHAVHVRQLFRELGLLDANGEWDERILCHSPQERLFQHGRWHEGLEPFDALTTSERAEFARFDDAMRQWRESGAFRVPTAAGHAELRAGNMNAVTANAVRALDGTNADVWLREQQFNSPALRWWVEYGTRDDFGASLSATSAWAAVHYFAARDAEEHGPLTWPEGNGWIVNQLANRAGDRILTNAPAYAVERRGNRWLVRTPRCDVTTDVIIWAAPLFVLPKVVPAVVLPVAMEYSPWVVANLTLRRPPSERGASPAWDNVIYNSPSLGYVDAGHQSVATRMPRRVWTWYHAVVDRAPADGRRWMQQRSWSEWRDQIVADLMRAHPDIDACIERIDIKRWGHAMARPVPGVLHRVEQLSKWTPAPNMFVAHADMSGLSLFEEAQWHGVVAAEQAARRVS